MAQNPNAPADLEKQNSRWGKFSTAFGKGVEKAKREMEKGAVKAKVAAQQSVLKVTPTPEDPDILAALERLKATKAEITNLASIARRLYDTRLSMIQYEASFASQTRGIIYKDSHFGAFMSAVGNVLVTLENDRSDLAENMKKNLVEPLEKFRDEDVEQVQKLKLRLYQVKSEYDISENSLEKAQAGANATPDKIAAAQEKRDSSKQALDTLRDEFKRVCETLEKKKDGEMGDKVKEYWQAYVTYTAELATKLNEPIDYQLSTPPPPTVTADTSGADYYGDDSPPDYYANEAKADEPVAVNPTEGGVDKI